MIEIKDLGIRTDFAKSSSLEAVHSAVIHIKNVEHEALDLLNAFLKAGMTDKADELDEEMRALALIRWNLELRELELKKKEAKG